MKAKSIQESILQQILALDEPYQPIQYPTTHSKPTQKQKAVKNSLLEGNYIPPQSYGKPSPSSIIDIQDQLLRMRARIAKMPASYQENLLQGQKTKRAHHNPNNNVKMRTEYDHHQQFVPPMNYSTIYTRRSSMDESLYDKALRQESVRKDWVNKKQKQIIEQQLKQCLHKPTINKTSKQIMKKVDRQQLYEKIKKKKQESIKKIIDEAQTKELKQCSFTPKIEKSQRKVTKSVKVEHFSISQDGYQLNVNEQRGERNSISIFDHLYEDSKSREIKTKKRQQNYLKQCKKKPVIDVISKQITKNTNFEDRMQIYKKRKLQKQAEKREKQNKSLRQCYRPTINSSSHHRRKQTSIHEYLYLQSKRQQVEAREMPAQKVAVNKKSAKVYEQRKILVFYQIFKLLDEDEDGTISINNINLQSLPHEVLRIIYPLIEELEVMEVQLHEHQFVHSISNLFKTLSVHQRDILLGFVGEPKQHKIDSGKPKINMKSKIMAQCNQRCQMSIYEYCSIRQAERERHLKTERIQKSKKQLEQCTFQPKILERCRS